MSDLPPELWCRVASFLHPRDLQRVAGVNRTFLELAMDQRWKTLKFSTGAIKIKKLERLREPFAANRVRDVTLVLYCNHEQSRSKRVRNLQRHVNLLVPFAFGILHGMKSLKQGLDMAHYGTFEEIMECIVRVAPKLISIRELTVRCTWSLIPSLSHNAMRPLLTSFSSTSGINLRVLRLEASLDELRVMLENRPTFCSLEELCLIFKEASQESEINAVGRSVLVDVIAPFIHNLGAHLKSLSIQSYCQREAQELEDFFQVISPLKSLVRLDIRGAFIKPSRYPRSLTALFTENLQHLSLPLVPFKLHLEPALQEPLRDWLLACISDGNLFTQLRSLDIYPTKTSQGLGIVLAYIHRSAKHLSQLTIRSRSFQPEEVPTLAHTLAQCQSLMDLTFNIHRLDISVFDELSRELPYLYRLCISVKERLDFRHITDQAASFFKDLQKKYYTDWNVKDIWIKNSDENAHQDVMHIIARSLPSARYLCGVPASA